MAGRPRRQLGTAEARRLGRAVRAIVAEVSPVGDADWGEVARRVDALWAEDQRKRWRERRGRARQAAMSRDTGIHVPGHQQEVSKTAQERDHVPSGKTDNHVPGHRDPCPGTPPPHPPPIPECYMGSGESREGEISGSGGVRAIKKQILAESKWTGYSEYEAEVTAMEIGRLGLGAGVHAVIAEAAREWAPTRSMHMGNGLHGYLVAYCSNRRHRASTGDPVAMVSMQYGFTEVGD